MSRPSDLQILTDLEVLNDLVPNKASALKNCRPKFRAAVNRSHDREYMNVTRGPVTLPKLKFLEGKDE